MADNAELTGLIVKIKADLSDYQQKLDQMGQGTIAVSNKISNAFKGITTIIAGTGVAISGFAVTALDNAMKWGNAVDRLSDKTGMAGEEASKLLVVAKRVGISVDDAGVMFSRFAKSAYTAAEAQVTAANSGKQADDAYTKLGVSVLNSDNTMRSASEVFRDVKEKIAAMPDGLQKTAMEMELFGRSGAEMHDLLNMTQEEMQGVIDKAQAMGLILSTDQAAAWEKLERDINSAKGTLTSIGIVVGNEMMPQLRQLLDEVQSVTKTFANMDREHKDNITTILQFISYAGSATLAVRALGLAVGVAVNPWVLLATAIGGATIALNNYLNRKWEVDNYNKNAKVIRSDVTGEEYVEYYDENLGANNWRPRTEDEKKAQAIYKQTGKNPEEPQTTPPPTQEPPPVIGNTGSSHKGPTEYEQYKRDTQDLINMWEKQVQLEQISYSDLVQNVQGRLDGLSNVNVLEKEIYDRDSLQADLQLKINSASKQAHDLAISRAESDLQLGNITKQQYADVIAKQLESATTTQEQIDLSVRLKKAQDDVRASIIETASQNVQLGKITLEEYAQILKAQKDSVKTDDDRLKLAVQIAQVQDELIKKQITQQERLNTLKQSALASDEESERHSLQMADIFSDGSLAAKKEYLASEIDLKRKNIKDEYDIELQLVNDKMKIYESKTEPLTKQEKSDYESLLQQKKQLTNKYNLDMQKANDDYVEKVASQQKKIIDTNNNMITSLITGTKSGHDILEDMWGDFVAKVVAKMFAINSEVNIFTSLLGGIFGISNTGISSAKSNAWTLSNGTKLDSNFGFSSIAGARAGGGDVEAGKSYIVGEKGIELFTPRYDGSIIPNSEITSGKALQGSSGQAVQNISNVTVQQTFNGQQDASVVAQIKASIPYIKSEIRNAINNESAMRNAVKGAAT